MSIDIIQKKPHPPLDNYKDNIALINNNELDIIGLFLELWAGRKWIIISTTLGGLIAFIAAFTMSPIYKAETILAPVTDQSSNFTQMLSGQLGGLANLAGVKLPGGSSKDISALATLQSRRFLINFIERRDLAVPLIATVWNPWRKIHTIDNDLFDMKTEKWVKNSANKKGLKPSGWQLYHAFKHILTISQDNKTQLITLTIEWRDPAQAAQWANWLVEDLNALLARQEREQAERSVAYLEAKLEETRLVQMQQATFQLIESQLKIAMLADATKEYAFKVIDPAVKPDQKSKPKNALILLFGLFTGCILGIMFVLLKKAFVQLTPKS